MGKRIKPVSRIIKIEAEINRIAGKAFVREQEWRGFDDGWVPYVDIAEQNNYIRVEIELPGVDRDDISILLHSSRLEVKGFKKELREESPVRYVRLEREYGNFRRIIFLPNAVVPEKAHASLENGILTLLLLKYQQKENKEVVLKIQKPKE